MEAQALDWRVIRAQLAAPFDPSEVDFRVQGGTFEKQGKHYAKVIAYIDARAVQDRLDAVCGLDGWVFDWQPIATAGNKVMAAKGVLTIHGISKSDVGDGGDTEPTKASVSDALKRSAVMFGVGRYLYSLGAEWAEVEMAPDGKVRGIAKAEWGRLRGKLPRPGAKAAA